MSVYTMHGYLSDLTADYNYTLSIDPQEVMTIGGESDTMINKGLGVTEERIQLSTQSRFQVKLQWRYLSEADHSTLFDLYHDPNKAAGISKTFYWTPPAQYLASGSCTVRFDCRWESFLQNYKNYGLASLVLAVLGKKA
ncbi:MAG: hypothetical protein PHN44_08095 [Candidatus Marinimicrobia bacterium]|nr:hypothetical protein [Candidatus Neomarinimicrobiota bacterium]